MLDDVVFAAEMTLLEDRFGRRPLTTETKVRYYEFLNQSLTTQEFQAAAREIFNRDQFWPSPSRFVEAARGNPKERAVSEWGQLMIALRDNPAELPLTDRGRAALKAVGGYRALMEATDYGMEKLHKRFLEAYVDEGERRVPVIEGRVQGVISEAVKAIQGEG